MAKLKKKVSYISVPSQNISSLSSSSLHSLIVSPKKSTKNHPTFSCRFPPSFLLLFLILLCMLTLGFHLHRLSPHPCSSVTPSLPEPHPWDRDGEFWEQPDGMGYQPCLEFSDEYRAASAAIVNDRRKYLLG